MVDYEVDASGLQRVEDRGIDRRDVYRTHEVIVQIMVVLHEPNLIKWFGRRKVIRRRAKQSQVRVVRVWINTTVPAVSCEAQFANCWVGRKA